MLAWQRSAAARDALRPRHSSQLPGDTLPVSHMPLPASTRFPWDIIHEDADGKRKQSTSPQPPHASRDPRRGTAICTRPYMKCTSTGGRKATSDAGQSHRGTPLRSRTQHLLIPTAAPSSRLRLRASFTTRPPHSCSTSHPARGTSQGHGPVQHPEEPPSMRTVVRCPRLLPTAQRKAGALPLHRLPALHFRFTAEQQPPPRRNPLRQGRAAGRQEAP